MSEVCRLFERKPIGKLEEKDEEAECRQSIFEFMSNLADMVMLNIVWGIACIPIVTIGAARTALYRIMLRRARGESNYPVREYLVAFKEDFGKSTKIWLVLLISGAILVFDGKNQRNDVSDNLRKIYVKED